MKRLLLFLLLCGCSGPEHVPVVPEGPARRTEGVVFSGSPTPGALAACSAGGAWQLGGAVVRHWIDQPEDGKRFFPPDGAPKLRLFRDSLPFPYLSWQPSDLQINQLVYPSGPGFVAQYHVMNHGSEARTCRLSVGITSREGVERDGRTLRAGGRAALVSVDEPSAGGGAALTYELTIEPGTSKFVHLTTPELQGSFAPELLNAAAEAWERRLGDRKFSAPDPALVTAYHADLAGAALGVAGCAEALVAVHERVARKEGEALRLLAGAPESWTFGSVHVSAMPTPFGPLTLRYEGAFSAMNYELGGACRPPGGFLVAVPPGFRARADGKDLAVQDGAARAPAGSKAVEISRSE